MRVILSIFLIAISIYSMAQTANVSKLWTTTEEQGDKLFESQLYSAALDQYKTLFSIDSAVPMYDIDSIQARLAFKIGRSHYKLREFDNASKYYKLMVDNSSFEDYGAPELLNYGEALLATGKREEAEEVYYKYFALTSDKRVNARFEGIQRWEEWFSITKPTTIEYLDINSKYSDIGARPLGNGVVYSSRESDQWPLGNKYLRGNMETFGVYYSAPDDKDSLHAGKPIKVGGGLYNVTSPAFGSNNEVIVSATKRSVEKGSRLKLFEGKVTSPTQWNGFKLSQVNVKGANLAYPSLTEGGDTLYFSVSFPDSAGGYDLYYSTRSGENWSAPVSLGTDINTNGHEVYPFAHKGKLYFASDGHPGLGGLDIFVYDGDEVINLHSPLNTTSDDFGISFIDDFQGYLTSNRPDGVGKDDVYHFTQTDESYVDLNISITSVWEKEPMDSVYVNVTALNAELGREVYTDTLGQTTGPVRTRSRYSVKIEKEGYVTIEDTITIELEDVNLNYALDQYFTYKAFVFSEEDHAALSTPLVHIRDLNTGRTEEVLGSATGYFEINELTSTKISILITRSGYSYVSDTLEFLEEEFTGTYSLSISKPSETFTLNDLLYDLNQYKLKDDHIPTLDSIAVNLNKFPNTRIVVVSHTDSKGTALYNLDLSQRRAESVKEYLVSQGVRASRIIANGKGEAELINRCSDGVNCTDEEHRANRRTEVQIFRNVTVDP